MLSKYKASILIQFSRIRLFATPCTAARQASLSITNSRSLPKPMSIESVMPSSHLILCRPLLLPPSIFPTRYQPGRWDDKRGVERLLPVSLRPGACIFTCFSMKKSQDAQSQSNYFSVSLINKSMCTLTVLKIQFKLFVCCCLL